MSQIVILLRAEWDVEDWRDYFDTQEIGLGTEFILAFQQGAERIAQFPRRYARHWGKIRICPVRPFTNIGIFYRLERNIGYVLRVLDLRRNPRRLRRDIGE